MVRGDKQYSKQVGMFSRGVGPVVRVLALGSDNPSMNPADAYSFFCTICH